VGDEPMARVGEEPAQHTKRVVRRQAETEQRMRGDARKAELGNRTGGESGNALEPRADFGVVLVVFPEQGHEGVDVEQAGHGVRLSSSRTSREVMTPPLARMTGRPSSPTATVHLLEGIELSFSTTKRVTCTRSVGGRCLIWS